MSRHVVKPTSVIDWSTSVVGLGRAHAGIGDRRAGAVVLYTCPARTHGATAPLFQHPCGVAAKALDDAGLTYTVKVVGGFKHLPLSTRGKREEVKALTGQSDVPVLVLDDGSTVVGSATIVAWAREGA